MTTHHDFSIFDDSVALLEKFATVFPRPADACGQSVQPAIRMLALGVDHGLRTTRGVKRLLADGEGNFVLACTLLRPFYELSVRLLWASRATDGWRRLYACYAKEDERWARNSLGIPVIASLAQEVLTRSQEVLAWNDAAGNPIKPAPNIHDILVEIETHNTQDGLSSGQGRLGQQHYRIIYQSTLR